jgi:hypothetical protein
MEMAREKRKAAQGGVCPASPWQSAGPAMCYGGWQATSMRLPYAPEQGLEDLSL